MMRRHKTDDYNNNNQSKKKKKIVHTSSTVGMKSNQAKYLCDWTLRPIKVEVVLGMVEIVL